MPYAGELQRNSPFSFQPPDVFSPWVDRCLTKLRLRLKDKGHNASSVRRIVRLLEEHLDAVSVFVLSSAESKVMLGRTCTTADAKAKFLSSTTPEQVRSCISDYDLLLRRWFSSDHLADIPSGYVEIEPFEKCAVLAIWKFAAGKESFEHVGATPDSIGLALEGMTAANLALAIHEGERLLPLEMHHRTQTTKRAVSEVIAAKKAESSPQRRLARLCGSIRGLAMQTQLVEY